MRTYDISIDGRTGKVPCPQVLPQVGDVIKVVTPFRTLAGFYYNRGDELKLIRRTTEMPHGRLSSLGNWVVRDRHHTSVWTNIEWMLAEGSLQAA